MNSSVQRYSDSELEEFRVLIEQKLQRAKEQLQLLQSQILEVTENGDGNYGQDMMDDSNTNTDVEMLNSLAIHQRKYIRELEAAMARIRNKTYGICEVTGDLIDKKRLMVVPTTTKSLAAKLGITPASHLQEEEEVVLATVAQRPPASAERPVITKVVRKLPKKAASAQPAAEEEDDLLLHQDWLDHQEEEEGDREISHHNMDEFSDEGGY